LFEEVPLGAQPDFVERRPRSSRPTWSVLAHVKGIAEIGESFAVEAVINFAQKIKVDRMWQPCASGQFDLIPSGHERRRPSTAQVSNLGGSFRTWEPIDSQVAMVGSGPLSGAAE